jgi:hypothetical protein
MLHEVYIVRIQRGDASFAAKVLGAKGALLAVLTHFLNTDAGVAELDRLASELIELSIRYNFVTWLPRLFGSSKATK